jgi:hypothetical protein
MDMLSCIRPQIPGAAIASQTVVTNGIEAMKSGGELDIAVCEAVLQCRITIRFP